MEQPQPTSEAAGGASDVERVVSHEINENALNDAGWKFYEEWDAHIPLPMPAQVFNNFKPVLREAIRQYLKVANVQANSAAAGRPVEAEGRNES